MRSLIVLLAIVLFPAMARAEPEAATLLASLEVGQTHWKRSCRRPDALGTCVSTRVVRRAHRCQERVALDKVHRRRPALAEKAQEIFDDAINQVVRDPDLLRRTGVAEAMAGARFAAAESAYEEFLRIGDPEDLDFSRTVPQRKHRSEQRFLTFIKEMQKSARNATMLYQEVLRVPGNGTKAWRIAARARLALVHASFARRVYGISVPRDVRSGAYAVEATEAFCDILADQARPLEGLAAKRFAECREEARGTPGSAWTALCEQPMAPLGLLSDRMLVRRIVRGRLVRVRACYEAARVDAPDLMGTLQATMVVSAAGATQEVSTAGLDSIGGCVQKALAGLQWPAAAGRDATRVVYPFHFRAR